MHPGPSSPPLERSHLEVPIGDPLPDRDFRAQPKSKPLRGKDEDVDETQEFPGARAAAQILSTLVIMGGSMLIFMALIQ